MEPIYWDESIFVCIKPAGVLSTDEPGGLPELVRQALGEPGACVRTVHRLDRVVSGLMVLARTPEAAAHLSRQIREQRFGKAYLAVVHGCPAEEAGCFRDLLRRDKAERKTYVTLEPGKGVQEAVLSYQVLSRNSPLSLVSIHLQNTPGVNVTCNLKKAPCGWKPLKEKTNIRAPRQVGYTDV